MMLQLYLSELHDMYNYLYFSYEPTWILLFTSTTSTNFFCFLTDLPSVWSSESAKNLQYYFPNNKKMLYIYIPKIDSRRND